MFPDQEPGWRGPPLKNHPTIDQFWGWFFRGVLFLQVLDLETTQQRKPPGRIGVSFDQVDAIL